MMSKEAAAKPADAPAIDQLLCFSIYSAGHAFNQIYRPLLEPLGLTYPQYLVMVALWSRDGKTVGELGDVLFLDSSTLTPLLKRLEQAGYIKRSRNPDDERQVLLHLTKAGRALQQRAEHIPGCIEDAVGMSGNDVAKVREALTRIRNQLAKD
jgi:DNA-binding MarR family transcriptional regulator